MTYDPMPDIYAAVGWPVDTAPVVHTEAGAILGIDWEQIVNRMVTE